VTALLSKLKEFLCILFESLAAFQKHDEFDKGRLVNVKVGVNYEVAHHLAESDRVVLDNTYRNYLIDELLWNSI
jgi:hypothetical protein